MRKALSLCILFLAGCAHSALPPATSSATSNGALVPQVWQRGTPPVHWVMFRIPSPDQIEAVYSWPLSDNDVVAYGSTCCYPGGSPATGSIHGVNISGSSVPITNFNPTNTGNGYRQDAPMKIVRCANNTQLCSGASNFLYGPNNQAYSANNSSVPDLTAGAGNSMWFTTCCVGSYIVYGNNGLKHYYRIPNTNDHLGDIARTSDGNIWVTLQHVGSSSWILAKLVPATSKVTEYPLQLQSNPAQLFVGPDGNLWFAIAKTLYRLTPSSAQITRFALPAASNGYLASGPRGTVWTPFVNSATSQGLIEATTTGTILGTFTCPSTFCVSDALNDRIQQLTQGPDGNMWFVFSNTTIGNLNPPPDPYEGMGVYVLQSMTVTPSAVTFSGAGKFQTIAISEANYAGTWTAGSTATSVVRVVKFLTPHQVQIESVGRGTGRVIIRDADGNYYSVNVTVQ